MADSPKTVTGYSGPYRGKNDYYRDGAHTLMFIVNFQAIIMVLLSVALSFYLGTRHTHDRYFAETVDGNTMQMYSQPLPNLGDAAIASWAATAASDVMTFGFNDFDIRLIHSSGYFTPAGWNSFVKALDASKLIKSIKDTQQIATAVPLSPPVVHAWGLINGKEGLKIDVPLLITFRAGSDIRPVTKTVHMVIERMSPRENPAGVGISEWSI